MSLCDNLQAISNKLVDALERHHAITPSEFLEWHHDLRAAVATIEQQQYLTDSYKLDLVQEIIGLKAANLCLTAENAALKERVERLECELQEGIELVADYASEHGDAPLFLKDARAILADSKACEVCGGSGYTGHSREVDDDGNLVGHYVCEACHGTGATWKEQSE